MSVAVRITLTSLVLLLAGCSINPINSENYDSETRFAFPMLGEEVTVQIGETMVKGGAVKVIPSIEIGPESRFSKSSLTSCAFSPRPGIYPKRGTYALRDIKAECYGPVAIRTTLSDGTVNWNCVGQVFAGYVCMSPAGNFFAAIDGMRWDLTQGKDQVQLVEGIVVDANNLVQEITYSGRTGDSLRLHYRELRTSASQPDVSKDLQFDLASSSLVGFGNLRLEILDADNTQIRYRMVSGF